MHDFTLRLSAVLVLILTAAAPSLSARALEIHGPFSDHMVLQRERPIRLWGEAPPGQQVRVTLASEHGQTQASTQGRWRVELPALHAGGPFQMRVTAGASTLTFDDVMIGEVWLCSGQSNMELSQAHTDDPTGPVQQVRFLKVPRGIANAPENTVGASWQLSTPTDVREVSAVGYAFACQLQKKLGVTVGMIESAYGGSSIAPWIRRQTLEGEPKVASFLAKYPRKTQLGLQQPQAHFNAMIAPLTPLELAGVLWYQGESDAGRGANYRYLLTLLLKDWRDAFQQPDLSFGIIQLPGYQHPGWRNNIHIDWTDLRDSQAEVAEHDPHAGLIVTYDLGDRYDIHPKVKKSVGARAAAWALGQVYSQNSPWPGPRFKDWHVEGNKAIVRFSDVDGALRPRNDDRVDGFAVLYHNGQIRWHHGTAHGDTVVLSGVLKGAEAIRYAWSNAPLTANLTDDSGLPARPFRTDDDRRPTAGKW